MAEQKTGVHFTTRATCFRGSNGGVGVVAEHPFVLDPDGTIGVWDSVAGHYTLHHGMTPEEEARVRALAPTRG